MNLFKSKNEWKNKCEQLQRENKRLKSQLKWMQSDFENMFEYVKEKQIKF